MRSMVIGKVYSARDLAFYDRGDLFPFVIVTNIDESIDSVLLPSMASVQDEVLKVKNDDKKSDKDQYLYYGTIDDGIDCMFDTSC